MSVKIKWERTLTVWEQTPEVMAAWAFGSAQVGEVREGGDVDIGVLVASPLSFNEQLSLSARLERALGFGNIDLVILNTANHVLRFEAISGRPLFCRDLARRAEFASLTAREYEDEMALWQRSLYSSRS